jgi:hypothetical protein
MEINLDIPDDHVQRINQWLSMTQKEVVFDPLTGGHVEKFKYPGGAEDFIEEQIGLIVYNILKMNPTEELRAQMLAAKKADDDFKAAVKPRRIAKAPVRS